jgi:hypothetical protein
MGLIKELAKDIVYGIGDFLTFGKGINRNIGGFNNILDSARFLAEMTAKHNFDV